MPRASQDATTAQCVPQSVEAARRPGLLVSVRDPDEALEAIAGGADVIDVKEPTRGPLGAADSGVVRAIASVVDARTMVTAALGELADWTGLSGPVPDYERLAVVKLGFARLGEDWRDRLAQAKEELPPGVELAPVGYADHAAAGSPDPQRLLEGATQPGGWMVLDTWDKSGPDSLELMGEGPLAELLAGARRRRVRVVLAGRLAGESLLRAASLGPALVGVRGAVCRGGRGGRVDRTLVERLVSDLAACRAGSTARR